MNDLLRDVVQQTNVADATSPKVHLFYEGRAWDLDQANLDVGTLSADAAIRDAVARSLDVPVQKLAAFRVERNEETGDLTLTPPATFGLSLYYIRT
jgi:hypothetical protein